MTDDEKLMQQALEAMEFHVKNADEIEEIDLVLVTALRERLEQPEPEPEPEPVAWHHPDCQGECIACLIERAVQDSYGTQGRNYLLRHVTPQPRQWVDLTDADIHNADPNPHNRFDAERLEFGRRLEAVMREKNGGGV